MDDLEARSSGTSTLVPWGQLDKATIYLVILPVILCIIFLVCWTLYNYWVLYLRRYTVADRPNDSMMPEPGFCHQDSFEVQDSPLPLLVSRNL